MRAEGFNKVLQAQNMGSKYFKIFFAQNTRPNAKLGIIASKRNFQRAVDRNRVKRIVREVFRHHSLKKSSLDVVVLVKAVFETDAKFLNCNLSMLLEQVKSRCAD